MRRFFERVLNLLRVRRPEDDVAREMEAHLALLQESYEARGLSPEDARRAARLAFGGIAQAREQHRDARSFAWIEDARRDAGLGLRLLRRSPVFTMTAALSLAVGIGANTAIFTVTNALLFRPPAGISDPSRLVVIGTARGDGGLNPLGYGAYLEIARRTRSLSSVFAQDMFANVMGMTPSESPIAEPVLGQHVTASFFSTLGPIPSRGRLLADGDADAAVLDFDYWQRRFSGDERIVGQVLRINGRPVTVIGVAPPGFHGTGIQRCDLWLSFERDDVASGSVMAGGRVRPDASLATAIAEIGTIGETIDRDNGNTNERPRRLSALPFSRASGNRNVVLFFAGVLMALVSLVLGGACANVAGIMLTRAAARTREMALRAALGAGRGRLARQLLTETTVLFLLGGLLGLGLASVLTRLAGLMLPALPTPIVVPLTLDWRVLLFALSLSLGAALVFGVLPAFRGSKIDAGASLKDGVRSSSGRSRLRSAFVVGQIASSVLLVVLGTSFVRVLRHAGAADPGFDPRAVAVAPIDLSVASVPPAGQTARWRALIDRVRQAPAVDAASLARVPPGGWEGIGLGGVMPGDHPDPASMVAPAWNIVDTSYFATLRIPLLSGRDFAPTDVIGAPPVVIVSDALARRLWPGENAVGKTVRLAIGGPHATQHVATVIGVAGDIRSSSLIDGLAEPYAYLALAQSSATAGPDLTTQMSIVVRHRGDTSVAPAISAIVHEIDPRLVVARVESLDDAVAMGLTPQRVLATIGAASGLVGLLLASMGIYGVTAYSVSLRRREFAIRLALGAPRARVVRMVLRQGATLVTLGLAVGLLLGIGAAQALAVFFYGLPAGHLPTLVGTALLFFAIGGAASLVPAGQAVRDGWRRALQED